MRTWREDESRDKRDTRPPEDSRRREDSQSQRQDDSRAREDSQRKDDSRAHEDSQARKESQPPEDSRAREESLRNSRPPQDSLRESAPRKINQSYSMAPSTTAEQMKTRLAQEREEEEKKSKKKKESSSSSSSGSDSDSSKANTSDATEVSVGASYNSIDPSTKASSEKTSRSTTSAGIPEAQVEKDDEEDGKKKKKCKKPSKKCQHMIFLIFAIDVQIIVFIFGMCFHGEELARGYSTHEVIGLWKNDSEFCFRKQLEKTITILFINFLNKEIK